MPNTDYTVVISTGGGEKNYPFRNHAFDLPGSNGLHLTYPAGAGVFSNGCFSMTGPSSRLARWLSGTPWRPTSTRP
jgi:hypothetical protein